jgi:peptidoglycan/LPS O-acetylase OafA/YrhL
LFSAAILEDDDERRKEMNDSTHHSEGGGGGSYWRFMAMVSTSTVIMFFLMYSNTFDADDIFWSETRFWMTFVMGGMMMIVMLLFMWGMYKDRTKNFIILGVGALTFALALWLVRSQTTVDDTEYMAAMIPHHSIAIMTSERASLKDPRVRELAKAIIVAQRREIAEMKYLIDDIEENGVRTEERLPEEMQK